MHTHRRQNTPKRITVALIATVLMAAGCSSGAKAPAARSTPVASSTAPPDATQKPIGGACDIVSDEVVASVLGVKVVRREGKKATQGAARGNTCIKGLARSNDPANFTFVSAAVFDGAGQGGKYLDQALGQTGSRSVSGVGERAVFNPSLGTIFVLVGGDIVQVTKASKPGTFEDCTAVAKDMLGRLG